MNNQANCEYCLNYEYDEETECYICSVDLDMDEFEMFMNNSYKNCPYFRINNEYKIVEKQN